MIYVLSYTKTRIKSEADYGKWKVLDTNTSVKERKNPNNNLYETRQRKKTNLFPKLIVKILFKKNRNVFKVLNYSPANYESITKLIIRDILFTCSFKVNEEKSKRTKKNRYASNVTVKTRRQLFGSMFWGQPWNKQAIKLYWKLNLLCSLFRQVISSTPGYFLSESSRSTTRKKSN